MNGFFAIDRRLWPYVCQLGMNPAVAYLVQACGTGRDNLTTSWSTHAVETYTNISRPKARAAVHTLVAKGYETRIADGTRPRYKLATWADRYEGLLDRVAVYVYQNVLRGDAIHDFEVEQSSLWEDGIIFANDGRYRAHPPEQPDYIWLPNTIVTGVKRETPPVERVRQTQDVMVLRLLVELYHAHNLPHESGVARQVLYQKFERELVGNYGEYQIWAFSPDNLWIHWQDFALCHRRQLTKPQLKTGENPGSDFFRRLNYLVDLGVVEMVPHLVEGPSPEAEIIHPYARSTIDSVEARLARTAHEAASAALPECKRYYPEGAEPLFAPVPRHIANVQMIGIARLRYRPHTRATGEWWSETNSRGEAYIRKYEEFLQRIRPRGADRTGTA